MKKSFKKILTILLASICLTGCASTGSSEPMTAEQFKSKMEEKNMTVNDQTASATDSSYQKIYVAVNGKKYSFDYYFMDSPESAETVYEYAVSNLDNTYGGMATSEISEKEKDNVKYYSISATDYYCEAVKKENTVLYMVAAHNYESEAKDILSDLGY